MFASLSRQDGLETRPRGKDSIDACRAGPDNSSIVVLPAITAVAGRGRPIVPAATGHYTRKTSCQAVPCLVCSAGSWEDVSWQQSFCTGELRSCGYSYCPWWFAEATGFVQSYPGRCPGWHVPCGLYRELRYYSYVRFRGLNLHAGCLPAWPVARKTLSFCCVRVLRRSAQDQQT